jgi:hypothetical protein
MSKYIAKSTIAGVVTTGRLILLFFPDSIVLDFEKEEVTADCSEPFVIAFSDVIDAELIHNRYCADILLESKTRRYTIRGLSTRKAVKIKHLLRNYIWNQIMKRRIL